MNEDIHFLALGSDNRYVARCSYGCVNLVWGRVSVHFATDEFLQIARFLLHSEDELMESNMSGGIDNYVVRHDNGYHELWLMGMGLFIDSESFRFLVALVQEAGDYLQETMGQWVAD